MSLRVAASHGVRWTSIATIAGTVTQVAGLIFLGRILSPVDFGLVAMMMVVFGLADLFGNMGIGDAIVQQQGTPTASQLSTLFWINLALGVTAYLMIMLALPLIVGFYGEPALRDLMPVAAISVVIPPLGLQVNAMLRKSLRFKPVALIELGRTIAGTVVSIICALRGWGVWALVAGQLTATAGGTIALLIIGARERWLPGFVWAPAQAKGMLTYGAYYFASNVVNFFNSRADHLLIGSLLGARELGYYSMALTLVMQPAVKMNSIVTQVVFPILAKVRDEKTQLRRWYLKMLDILATANAPMLLGLAAVAPLFVPLFLGNNWAPAIPVLQVLALFSLIRSAGNAGGTLIYAAGNARFALFWNLGLLLLVPSAVFVGAHAGALLGVATALATVQAGLFLVWYFVVVRGIVGNCFFSYVEAFFSPTILALVMAGLVWYLAGMLKAGPPLLVLPVLIIFGAVTYIAAYRMFFREEFREYLSLLLNRAS